MVLARRNFIMGTLALAGCAKEFIFPIPEPIPQVSISSEKILLEEAVNDVELRAPYLIQRLDHITSRAWRVYGDLAYDHYHSMANRQMTRKKVSWTNVSMTVIGYREQMGKKVQHRILVFDNTFEFVGYGHEGISRIDCALVHEVQHSKDRFEGIQYEDGSTIDYRNVSDLSDLGLKVIEETRGNTAGVRHYRETYRPDVESLRKNVVNESNNIYRFFIGLAGGGILKEAINGDESALTPADKKYLTLQFNETNKAYPEFMERIPMPFIVKRLGIKL